MERNLEHLFKEIFQAQICRIQSHFNISTSRTLAPRDLKGILQNLIKSLHDETKLNLAIIQTIQHHLQNIIISWL